MMKTKIALTLISLMVSTAAVAELAESESYLCSHEQMSHKRLIELIYTAQGQPLPCEVKYSKGSETQVLWQAKSQLGYCEQKLAEFLEKQANWGWQCDKVQ